MRTTNASAAASFGVTEARAALASGDGAKVVGRSGLGDVHDLDGQVVVVAQVAQEPVGDDGAEAAVAVAADDEGDGEGSR